MCTCMLANVTYAIAGDHMPINRAYQPPTTKHVSQIARNRYQTTLRADQLRGYDKLHAARHATGAKVFTDLRDDDDYETATDLCQMVPLSQGLWHPLFTL